MSDEPLQRPGDRHPPLGYAGTPWYDTEVYIPEPTHTDVYTFASIHKHASPTTMTRRPSLLRYGRRTMRIR